MFKLFTYPGGRELRGVKSFTKQFIEGFERIVCTDSLDETFYYDLSLNRISKRDKIFFILFAPCIWD